MFSTPLRTWGQTNQESGSADTCRFVLSHPERFGSCLISSCLIAGSPDTMGRLCLVPDIELTVSLTVIGIFFLFVFVFDNQKNINIGMILGNKFILLFNSCDTNIAVM